MSEQRSLVTQSIAGSLDRPFRFGRKLLPIYIGALVLSAPLVLGLFAYGLAHAGDGAFGQLLVGLAVLFVIAAGPPLALLSKSTAAPIIVLKVLGVAIMLAASGGMLMLVNFWWLEPQWMKLRFHRAMSAIEVVSVAEEPVELQGRVIGLKIVREVDVKRHLELDRYGSEALGALRTINISLVGAPTGAQSPFDVQVSSRLLTIDDREPAAGFEDLSSRPRLFAGRYRTEHIVLLSGLRSVDWPQQPCRDDEFLARAAAALDQASGHALQVQSVARLSFGSRRGYDWASLKSMPLRYRYEHSSWMRGVQQLPIHSCKQQEEQATAQREEAQRLERERWYSEGDTRLGADDNPLFSEMCANDLDAVRARLARGTPAFNLSGKIVDCTITKPQLEMFALVMPALYARAKEREGYCTVLRSIHSRRALPYLTKVAESNLPLTCEAAEDPPVAYRREACKSNPAPDRCIANTFAGEHAWRAGLYPSDDTGWINRDLAERVDTLQWLQLLRSHGVAICKTLADNTNLLQEMVSRSSPEVVAYLVNADCDAHVRPPFDPSAEYVQLGDASAAVHWFMRTHGFATYGEQYAPLDSTHARHVARAMGELTASDINYASVDTGISLLHRVARYLPERPELLQYLIAHGARLDVADKNGRSWFDKGYTQIYGREQATEAHQARLLNLLDLLTVPQLRELLAPKNSLTGEPGQAIEEYDFAPGQLTIYLCERGARQCAR